MFLTLIIENLPHFNVPKWVNQKLIASDIVPTNNLLDFQNYILLETGYPFEFYDYNKICTIAKISNLNLSIKHSKKKQKFLASNNFNYELDNSILTLTANDIPISIAGLIQGKEFQVSTNTTKILIEGAIFDGAKIRQQSRKLGLRTERSARYEKSVRDTYFLESIYRLIHLLRISNPELICQLDKLKTIPTHPICSIELSYSRVNEILGPIYMPNKIQVQ